MLPAPVPTQAAFGTPAYRQITFSLFLAGICAFAQLYFMQPLLPVLGRYFKLTPAHSSLVISAATGALAAGLLLGTFLADRYPRKPVMSCALISSCLLTLAAALAPTFTWLVVLSALKGFTLAGVAALAMAYLGEEVAPAALSRSMGLYITGTIMGGMLGRVLASLLADWFSWRVITTGLGLGCLALALEFVRRLPPSRHFMPRQQNGRAAAAAILRTAQDPTLVGLCLFAALAMGSFVSVYNYLSFRLEAPPFSLPQHAVAGIFLLYAVGMGGAFAAGPIADKTGLASALAGLVLLMLGGLLATGINHLFFILVGLGVFTCSFFGAHTLASSWVGRRTLTNKSAASSLYLFCYYAGASVVGTLSGLVLMQHGWSSLVLWLGLLLSIAWVLTLRLGHERQ
ncbi:MAG: MFS transporter [Bacteroidota bacterium]|nr:MFS transporter [Bacteroidota bacterium]